MSSPSGGSRNPLEPLRRGASAVALLGAGQGAALVSLLLISHSATAEVFGQLTSGLAVQNYVVLIGTLGLRTVVVRDLARNPKAIGEVWGTLWLLVAFSGACVATAGHLISGMLFEPSASENQMSVYLSCGAWFSMLSVVCLLDSLGRQVSALAVVAVTEVAFLCFLQAGFIPTNAVSLGSAFAVKWSVAAVLQACILYRSVKPIRWRFSGKLLAGWLRSAPPLLTTSLLMNLPIAGAVILARTYLGASDSAVIGLSGQLASAIILLGGVAVRFVQPVWRDRESLGDREVFRQIFSTAQAAVFVWLLGVVGVTALIWGWLPAVYFDGLASIHLFLLASAFAVAARVLWVALIAVDDEVKVLSAYGVGGIVFLGLSVSLSPIIGLIGIAVAAALSKAVTTMVMWRSVRSLLPQND